MALIRDLALQGAQMLLVLVLAPLLLGFTRKVKARMLRRRGPPVLQPYRDLLRLIRKEAVIADNASWLFRSGPYMIFAATWVELDGNAGIWATVSADRFGVELQPTAPARRPPASNRIQRPSMVCPRLELGDKAGRGFGDEVPRQVDRLPPISANRLDDLQ